MASLIESLLNDPVRRLDNKRIDIVRRPMPTRQRDMLELLAALGPNASMEALRRGIDMRNADPRTTFFAVLGRWPSQAELEALGPTYETWPHLRRLLISEEFRAPIVRRVLDAYAEKRRLLFIRIPRCAGAHCADAMASQHPMVPTRLNPTDLTDLLRTLGTALTLFSRARTVGVIHDNIAPFIAHEPHFKEKGDPLGWRYTAAPFRNGDLLFAIIRPPKALILSQVNAVLTGLRQPSPPANLAAWQKKLGPLPGTLKDVPAWRALGSQILAQLELHNPICAALGDGTAATALATCRSMPITLVALHKYELWVQTAIEVPPEPPSNVSEPIMALAELGPEDQARLAALTAEDEVFYNGFAAKLAALDTSAVLGPQL
jgi:hypothetical protein